jgi:4-hydroxy-tetrahydrodipicolinate reductase
LNMKNSVTVALVGAGGRMGLEITRVASSREDVRVGAAVEHAGSIAVGQDLGVLAGVGANGVVIGVDMLQAFTMADVVIDLSLPSATPAVVADARAAKKPLVCGTTGLDEQTLALFDSASADIAVLQTPNLSPGIAVTKTLVERAAAALGPDYDIEIVELHHRDKVDAPSGTALALADAAARSRGLGDEAYKFGREGHTGPRTQTEIGIHAVRGGGVFGEHTVILSGRNERIEITHRAASRTLFAEGALKAAIFLSSCMPGCFSMKDVLGLD